MWAEKLGLLRMSLHVYDECCYRERQMRIYIAPKITSFFYALPNESKQKPIPTRDSPQYFLKVIASLFNHIYF